MQDPRGSFGLPTGSMNPDGSYNLTTGQSKTLDLIQHNLSVVEPFQNLTCATDHATIMPSDGARVSCVVFPLHFTGGLATILGQRQVNAISYNQISAERVQKYLSREGKYFFYHGQNSDGPRNK